jgi:hypothetical protein
MNQGSDNDELPSMGPGRQSSILQVHVCDAVMYAVGDSSARFSQPREKEGESKSDVIRMKSRTATR